MTQSNEPALAGLKESDEIKFKLLAPFPESDLEWRVQSAGVKGDKTWCKVLVYVTNRAIMERLDSVLGINGWQNEFKPLDGGGYLCGISCKFGDEWIIKWDGADKTDIEATKGGISSSMKRAGVQWGIGRYLYNVTVMWGEVSTAGKLNGQWKDKQGNKHYFKYNSPKLPTWALPNGSKNSPEKPPVASTSPDKGNNNTEADDKYYSAMVGQLKRLGKEEFNAVLYACFDIKDGNYKTITDKQKREDVWNALNKTTKEAK